MPLLLHNQHGVTETEEAVSLLHRVTVGLHDVVMASAKALTSMISVLSGKWEVGNESIDHLERIAGIDKDIGPSLRRLHLAPAQPHAFQRVRQLVVLTAMTRPPSPVFG